MLHGLESSGRRGRQPMESHGQPTGLPKINPRGASAPSDSGTASELPNRRGLRGLDETIRLHPPQAASSRDERAAGRRVHDAFSSDAIAQRVGQKPKCERAITFVSAGAGSTSPSACGSGAGQETAPDGDDESKGTSFSPPEEHRSWSGSVVTVRGMPLMECLRPRVKDIDLDLKQIAIHGGRVRRIGKRCCQRR